MPILLPFKFDIVGLNNVQQNAFPTSTPYAHRITSTSGKISNPDRIRPKSEPSGIEFQEGQHRAGSEFYCAMNLFSICCCQINVNFEEERTGVGGGTSR